MKANRIRLPDLMPDENNIAGKYYMNCQLLAVLVCRLLHKIATMHTGNY
jgi:hypothetical protein